MSRQGFQYCTRHHSCLICGDTNGRCRTRDDLVLCMSNCNGEAAGDTWHFIGPNKGSEPGTWGVYVPFDERRRKRGWRETYLDDIQSDLAADALRLSLRKPRPVPAPVALKPGYTETPTANIQQRHDAYSALFRGSELRPGHRRNLSDRYGFTVDDSNAHLLGAISVNSTVGFEWHHPFPGSTGSDHWASFRNGMALAITDEQQRILGVELRLDDPGDGGRYRWLSRPEHCQLGIPEYDGENPLGLYGAVRPGLTPEPCTGSPLIAISEGRGMKPRIAASRWGCPVIGGGGHAAATGSPIQLNRYLLLNPGATVLLLVDAGGLSNHRVVMQLLLTVIFCRQRGHEVLIPWWSQKTAKVDPDPDETPHTHGELLIGGARYIAWGNGRNIPLWRPEALGLVP